MRYRCLWAAALLACTVLIVGTPVARAALTVVRPEAFSFEAEIPTKHGWAAFLRADGHRRIELFIHHYDEEVRPYVTMSYETVGHVDRHGISADFGRFGRIDLAFARSPKRELFPFPNCKGSKPEVNQYGEMHGTIDFEGLGGLIGFRRTQVEGQTRHSPRRTCVPKPSNTAFGTRDERRVEPGGLKKNSSCGPSWHADTCEEERSTSTRSTSKTKSSTSPRRRSGASEVWWCRRPFTLPTAKNRDRAPLSNSRCSATVLALRAPTWKWRRHSAEAPGTGPRQTVRRLCSGIWRSTSRVKESCLSPGQNFERSSAPTPIGSASAPANAGSPHLTPPRSFPAQLQALGTRRTCRRRSAGS
jgi:hypothetical protein